MKTKKRSVDLLVLSDIHLGTYGCQAKALLHYLKSIQPKKVILNGDIIDGWQFSKRYWPKSHMKVIKQLTGWLGKGTEIIYIPGNHDEMMRRFAGFRLGNFRIANQEIFDLPEGKAWAFHGDVFDVSIQHSRWLALLGAKGYDALILFNQVLNFFSRKAGRGPIYLSAKVKQRVKKAVSYINSFEQQALEIAGAHQFRYIICGHIHQPEIRTTQNKNGLTTYLNSGDWVESLSALEYHQGHWRLYNYRQETPEADADEDELLLAELDARELFRLVQMECRQEIL